MNKAVWLLALLVTLSLPSMASTMAIPSTLRTTSFEVKGNTFVKPDGSLALYSNTTISNPVAFVAGKTYKFSVKAYGTSAGGIYPKMSAAIDGAVINTVNVDSTALKTFTFNSLVQTGGTRQLALSFINDAQIGTEDRNLFIWSLAIEEVAGTPIFQETFSQPKYHNSNGVSDGVSQLMTNGWGSNGNGLDGPLWITPWPLDASQLCVQNTYVNSDDGAKHRYYLPPFNMTELWAVWDEYRSADFDFGPTKDGSFNLYNSNVEHQGQIIHVYWGMGTGLTETVGQDNASVVGVNIQGANAVSQVWSSGDSNNISNANWAMQRSTAYRFKIHVKLNTPGYSLPGNPNASDGVVQVWVNGTKVLERVNVKFAIDGVGNYYIHSFQLGMSATNGGLPFSAPSEIYRKNIIISNQEVW